MPSTQLPGGTPTGNGPVVMATSPVLTTPTLQASPTPSDNSLLVATTAFVKAQNYITSAGAPVQSVAGRTGAIVLAESDITNLTTDLAAKAALASPTFTGVPLAPTAAVNTNTTQLATTAFVIGQGYATLASPTLTGVPAAPTAAANTNTTQLATTAYVVGQGYAQRVVSVDLTAQAATITNATLLAAGSVQTGMYRLNGWTKVTRAATTSSTSGPLTITFTEGTDSTSLTPTISWITSAGAVATTNATNVTTVTGSNTFDNFTFFAKAGVAITYTFTYTSSGATTMQFDLHMRLEFLG
jgi:hypothetical protein